MLCVVVLLIFNSNISGSIGTRIKEIAGASSIETKIEYEIQKVNDKLEVFITVENEKGLERVTLSDGLTLKCKSKKKIAIDREKLERYIKHRCKARRRK